MHIKKILSYNPYGDSKEYAYHYVCDLLMQKNDPSTLEPNRLSCENRVVYTSPRARALSCLDQTSALQIVPISILNEIPFDLKKYCSEEEFLQKGSTAVRLAFVDAFIANDLMISHEQLAQELKEITQLPKNALCISHTFRMKIIDVYSKIGDELFRHPALLKKFIDTTQHLFPFGYIMELK